jgi:hydrogenase maturation factor
MCLAVKCWVHVGCVLSKVDEAEANRTHELLEKLEAGDQVI